MYYIGNKSSFDSYDYYCCILIIAIFGQVCCWFFSVIKTWHTLEIIFFLCFMLTRAFNYISLCGRFLLMNLFISDS